MTPATPKTSSRLLRAAAAERSDLDRHRDRLLARRDALRADLERIEAALVEVDERVALLARLAPPGAEPEPVRAPAAASGTPLRGTAIRETAVRVLARSPHAGGPIHYRRWLELVEEAGYAVTGKDPAAVFLTQISRSPVIRKTSRSGVYELDRDAPERLRRRLAALQGRLRTVTAAPADAADAADLAAIRAQREQALAEITQTERALEEAARSLATPAGGDVAAAAG
jgi:hypothetical protein